MVAVALALVACDRMATKLSGGFGPEAGILRGKLPVDSRGVNHLQRLTDGIAAEPGDPARTDLTANLSGAGAFVTWDLGFDVPVRCALVEGDGDARFEVSLSKDGRTFEPLWTAPVDEDRGLQLRAGRDLRGVGRYLRLAPAGGGAPTSLAEVSAWTECPKAWPVLAMQRGTPVDAGLLVKTWIFEMLALGYILSYRSRRPDWVKLLGVVPAGLGLSLALAVVDAWPLTGKLLLSTIAAVAWIVIAVAVRLGLAHRARMRDLAADRSTRDPG